jgi:hypothetical protein
MLSKEDSICLLQQRIEEYRPPKNNMGEVVEELDNEGRLGHGFSLVDELDEVDIGDVIISKDLRT